VSADNVEHVQSPRIWVKSLREAAETPHFHERSPRNWWKSPYYRRKELLREVDKYVYLLEATTRFNIAFGKYVMIIPVDE